MDQLDHIAKEHVQCKNCGGSGWTETLKGVQKMTGFEKAVEEAKKLKTEGFDVEIVPGPLMLTSNILNGQTVYYVKASRAFRDDE